MNNADMNDYWNGDGGRTWMKFQDRIDLSLVPFGEKAMEAALIGDGDRVLDIGCGCGDTTFEISRRIGGNGYVQGIDFSDLILEHARKRNRIHPQKNIEFKCTDVQLHAFEAPTFDVVYSRYGIMFFDDPRAAFNNIRQALKPGGRMGFICWQSIKRNQWVNLPLEVAANHVTLPDPPGLEDPGAFSFSSDSRVRDILSAAGFIDISVKRFEATFTVGANLNEAVSFLSQIGPASIAIAAHEVDNLVRDRFASELHNTLRPHVTTQGVVLNAATWVVTAINPL